MKKLGDVIQGEEEFWAEISTIRKMSFDPRYLKKKKIHKINFVSEIIPNLVCL